MGPKLEPSSIRRVKQAIRAWKPELSDTTELIPKGTIAPVGEPVSIDRFEEIEVLRSTRCKGEALALICWRDALYLVTEEDLEKRTIRVFKSLRRS
jgi:hypothetical protein